MLDWNWENPELLIGDPPISTAEAIGLIGRLPSEIAGERAPEYIDVLYLRLALWLEAELTGNQAKLALLHSDPAAVGVRPRVDFSLAMWSYAGHLLPRSPRLQRLTGNSKLMLWGVLELSCCSSLFGRGGVTRLPDFDPATGRIAGDKAIKGNTRRAIKLHRQAIKYGPGVYQGARNPPPKKYRHEYLLDGTLQHGITCGWNKSDKDLLHHCGQLLNSFEHYELNHGPMVFFLRNGEVHVCDKPARVPSAKGFLPPKPRGKPRS